MTASAQSRTLPLPFLGSASPVGAQLAFYGVPDDEVIELQCLSKGLSPITLHQRADTIDTATLPTSRAGVYLIANRKRPEAPPQCATERSIEAWRVMMIDVDYDRPSGTSTTDEQLDAVYEVAFKLAAYMAECGFPVDSGAWVESGNGVQLHVRLADLPPDETTKGAVNRIVRGLASRFNEGHVKIDTSVGDAKRLYPLAGTIKRKGEGPHREVQIYPPPRPATPVTLSELLALAEKIGPTEQEHEPSTPAQNGIYARANRTDMRELADKLGILHERDEVTCPGCKRHSGSMAAIVGGVIKCLSDTCKPHHDGVYTPVDTLAAVRGITPIEAARQLAGAFLATDVGNAERFACTHHDNVRYVPGWKRWLIWNGQCWAPDDSGKICELAKRVTHDMITEGNTANNEQGQRLIKWALKSQSSAGIAAMVKLATTVPDLVVMPDALDSESMLLAVQNGTLDLRTGTLRPHRREDMITKILPYAFDASAPCPQWERFLARILGGDLDLIAYVQRAVGYTLTASVSEQVLFVLHGDGKNGKSTFTTTLQALLGSYAMQASETLLLENRGEHTTEKVDLMGKRLAVCSETPKGRFFNENRVKELTGGDLITGRRMRADNVTFAPSHKLWICTNNRPNVRELTEAIKRRIKMVPFDVTIPEVERDHGLMAKLRTELPGILAWAMRGCLEWQSTGLRSASRVENTTAAYFTDQDSVARFVAAECVVGSDLRCGTTDLYRDYSTWARDSVEGECLSQTAFGLRLESLGYHRHKTNVGAVRKGLTLRTVTGGDGLQVAF